jgi:protein-arginine kinase activator protein McsA
VGEREKQIAVLRGQLAAAIASEQYEKAARIRDELKALGDPNLQGPGAGGAGGGGGS